MNINQNKSFRRQLQGSNLCGQSPFDFKSNSLTTRTSCLSRTLKCKNLVSELRPQTIGPGMERKKRINNYFQTKPGRIGLPNKHRPETPSLSGWQPTVSLKLLIRSDVLIYRPSRVWYSEGCMCYCIN
jgi:hypothetical protein